MKTEWDYSTYADGYLKRPDYSINAVRQMLEKAQLGMGARICDVGAGAAHLTKMMAEFGYEIVAVEPNDKMRSYGIQRTKEFPNVTWIEGVGENTRQQDSVFDLVTFGSSFNVCNQQAALAETHRILKQGGYFACMWNHRDLKDPIQSRIEAIIKENIPTYSYGTRRQSPQDEIEKSQFFTNIEEFSGVNNVRQTVADCVEAWRSHATLGRQAGSVFPKIIEQIESYLSEGGREDIPVTYVTHIWMARAR